MPDLLVSLFTRNGPDRLDRSLGMFYGACSNASNFDFQIIIDSDQIELYKSVTDRYPNAHKTYVEHIENSWLNIINAQFNFMKEHDYYFIWSVVMTHLVYKRIGILQLYLRKKHFKTIFSLYTQCLIFGVEIKKIIKYVILE